MSMLKLQIGPVQAFIAAARTTRDLWSGSYLLSWLMASGIKAIEDEPDCRVIFPCASELSIYRFYKDASCFHPEAATPCLTNKLTAWVPKERAEAVARKAEEAIRAEWDKTAETAWSELPPDITGNADLRARFLNQVKKHLTMDYATLPVDTDLDAVIEKTSGVAPETPLRTALETWRKDHTKDYAALYHLLDYRMDSVRRIRHFEAWNIGNGRDAAWKIDTSLSKDSLTGKEEGIYRWNPEKHQTWKHHRLFAPFPHDVVGAITLIKRLWYLKHFEGGRTAHLPKRDQDAGPSPYGNDKTSYYYAVLAMDGDQIGKKLTSADKDFDVDEKHLTRFSSALGRFAQKKACTIVHKHHGDLIYAGGDDVLALLPLSTALECALELRNTFRSIMQSETNTEMDMSAGLSFVHSKADLQSAIAAARNAESRAKGKLGRGAFSICLMKRSGEIHEWGAKWSSNAIELIRIWQTYSSTTSLSARASHRYSELLTPYINHPTGMCEYKQDIPYLTHQKEIAMAELRSMLDRQCTDAHCSKELQNAVRTYMDRPSTGIDLMEELIGLCAVIGFLNRVDVNE